MALKLGARLLPSLAPTPSGCLFRPGFGAVCAAPGGTLRTLGNYGVKPAFRSPAGPIPVWIHFLYFSVRLLAPDPSLKRRTSLPSTSRFLPTQRSLELAGKEAALRPTLSLPPRNQAVLQARRNLLSGPGGSPRPGGQVRSFRVGPSLPVAPVPRGSPAGLEP